MWCPPGCSTSWTTTCGSSPTSGRSGPIHTSRSTGSSPGTSARSTPPDETGGCSATVTAAPTCLNSPGPRSPGTRWSRGGPHQTTRPWPTTGRPGDVAGDPRWTGPGCGFSRRSGGAARAAATCCSTPTGNRNIPTSGSCGSQPPARRSASQPAPAVNQHFCISDLDAFRACLSPVRPNGARRVLRGRRRSNAPPLPDWKGVFYLLEAHGFQTWLAGARDVKHLPGRPKTDTLDAVWLCKVAERQMLRPSFVPPPAIRQLRDVARYRVDLVAVRTAEKQRVEQAAGWTPRSNS